MTQTPRTALIINRTGHAWQSQQVQEPCLLPNPKQPGRLVMFYSGVPETNRMVAMIGKAWADAADPFTWHEAAENPVFAPGDGWDRGSIRLDCVLYVPEEDAYYIYYSGTVDMIQDRIGLAICPAGGDGYSGITVDAIKRHGTQPVLAPEAAAPFYEEMASQAAVWREWDAAAARWDWFLYYSYRGKDGTLPGIRLATSTDGKTWTRQFNAADPRGMGQIFKSEPDAYYEWHQISKIGSTYVLSMEMGPNRGARWRPVLAVSDRPDRGWRQLPADTLLQTGWSELYREDHFYHVATPAFYKIGGRWLLFMQACAKPPSANYIDGRWDMRVVTCDRWVQPLGLSDPLPAPGRC
ncbi:MAG: hypothetical protein KA257_02970 [Opitutaceae bacterium]|jgi:hypothetical protein|nr:hypothetical protein [Opitutaceae bacterium]MBP9912191.1 hypothetical protein [Opitutaceae bacterium]